MLELVGSEEKDTKVKVRVEIGSCDDIHIFYDDIFVAYMHHGEGRMHSVPLATDDIDRLRGKGVVLEDNRLKLG